MSVVAGFLDILINGTTFEKGLFVTAGGMFGVFTVLILYYLLIIIVKKIFPYRKEEDEEQG